MKKSVKVLIATPIFTAIVAGIVVEIVSPVLGVRIYDIFKEKSNTGNFGKPDSLSEFMSQPSDIPNIIQELITISDATVLRAKLNEYSERGIVAVGRRGDFEDPDGIFVFVLDEERVYRTFLFRNQSFFDLQTNTQLVDLPKQFNNKQKIWVIESRNLVRPNY